MYFCLRVDLDYVPWDTPDAKEFGHGEPAALLRLLELAKDRGYRYQFFVSNRVLRAFPSEAEAILHDGHALDWLCKHPVRWEARYEEARQLFEALGGPPQGLAVRQAWPESLTGAALPSEFRFLSSTPGAVPAGLKHFPVELKSPREVVRSGQTMRSWVDAVRGHMRTVASVGKGVTVPVRPQVLARHDPRLALTREILELAPAIGLKMSTLRDWA